MIRIFCGILFITLISCASTKEMSEETYEKNKAICLEQAENFNGATLDDLVYEFGRPVYENRDIANNLTLVFSCLESGLFIHFTFNQFGEMLKYEVKRTMLAN
jgi:hypothetical protein